MGLTNFSLEFHIKVCTVHAHIPCRVDIAQDITTLIQDAQAQPPP